MKESILVVDDEECMRRLCGRILAGLGYEPVFAASVGEAREKLAAMPALDLLVTDLRLPDGHGLDVIRSARDRFPGAGVLVITAFLGAEGRAEEFRAAGVAQEDIISKPFDVSSLERAVAAKLGGRPVAEERKKP